MKISKNEGQPRMVSVVNHKECSLTKYESGVLVQFEEWHGRPGREHHAQDARATSN